MVINTDCSRGCRVASRVPSGARRQGGQAYTEYVLVMVGLVMTLLADIPKPADSVKCPGGADQCTALQMVMETMRQNYQGYAYAITNAEHPDPVLDPNNILDELLGD